MVSRLRRTTLASHPPVSKASQGAFIHDRKHSSPSFPSHKTSKSQNKHSFSETSPHQLQLRNSPNSIKSPADSTNHR
ncbi:hypothetical protein B0T16DRAFT_148250 [Cercophora newfieldiana]|uniref:Uncharacterized protein n=1 Tax=Cercophora newfieldiana TaxID=92897 RepID=A0AA39Y6D4_9PEZI|nr:hypothetical protein B0T16DRAFT_148250 [Cercophora newfieldiana]